MIATRGFDSHSLRQSTILCAKLRFRTISRAKARCWASILGAASVELEWNRTSIIFSGDPGRHDDPIMLRPEAPAKADYLVVELTFGDCSHPTIDPQRELQEVVATTTK
jgi:metallo-beta-lactamase family protein